MGKKIKSKTVTLPGTTSDNASLNDILNVSCEHRLPCGICKLTNKQCGKLYPIVEPYIPYVPTYPTYPDYPIYPTYPTDPIKNPIVTWKYWPELEPKICDPIPNINNQSICTGSNKDNWINYTEYSKKK